jgi:hypothetical protein
MIAPLGSLPLPFLAEAASGAPWPVWRDSTRGEVKFRPMPKREAVKLYHKARRFERETRTPGHQDGAIGRNGLAILQALIFDCLDYASGKLMPSYRTLVRKTGISERSVGRGLQKLKAAGVIHWLRRCIEEFEDGVFRLRQLSNAYAILPVSQWRGYPREGEPPAPEPWQWGARPPQDDIITRACREAGAAAMLRTLEEDPRDELAAALARLGRGASKRW